MPYSGPDIGGFSGSPSSELFIRWFQLASFLPFFRTHCAFFLPNREPWEFGEEALQILRQQLKWRYRLLPYWYTLAWQTSQNGHPLVRPLWWHDPQDQQLWVRADAFLVGEALLVAPILREGAQRRKLYLPRGIWYPWNSGRSQQGGIEVTLEAPLEDIPVLVRAGSLIPEAQADRLVLHCYRPPDGTVAQGQLFSDSGDGFGQNRLDLFQITPSDEYSYEFEWRWQGEYAFPYERLQLHLHGFEQHAVTRFKVADPNMDRLIEIVRS
jgi:alpha-glucosidase